MAASSKYGPYKIGDKHQDGRIFYRYEKGKECWVTEETFQRRMKNKRDYYAICVKEFNKKAHPPLYTCKEGLYYVGSSYGKERWVTYNQYLSIKRGRKIIRKTYYQEGKKKIKEKYKMGQQHPENSELFFFRYENGKPRWLNHEAYLRRKEMKRKSDQKKIRKSRIRRARLLSLIKEKIKKGTEKDGLIFWDYGSRGNEIWIDKETYAQRKEKIRQQWMNFYYKHKNV